MKRILFIATGGTIASRRSEHGLTPVMTSEELLSYVPQVRSFCEVDTVKLFNLDSTNITPAHWVEMAATIERNYEDYDGFVLSHGTDTMAYTAAALSYLIQNSPKPIILTGAQKPIDMESTDARINLADSFTYASFERAGGVQIVFNGNVILGTRAKKTYSKNYNAFSSVNYPFLAAIRDGQLFSYIEPAANYRWPIFCSKLSERVGVIKLTPGASADLLDCYLRLHDAVIIESYGTGGLPQGTGQNFSEVIDRYAGEGKVIVMTTQVANDGSDMSVYKVGGEIKNRYNLLEAYDMTTEAALTKLMWILGQTTEPAAIRRMFRTTIANDILYQEKTN